MRVSSLAALMMIAAGSASAQSGSLITHQFVLRLDPQQAIQEVLQDHNLILLNSYAARGLYLVAANPAATEDDEQIGTELGMDDRLIFREQNRENYAEGGHTQSFFVGIYPDEFISQPAFRRIGIEDAPTRWDGQGITIAILDTGVAPHFEYWLSLRSDGGNFIDSQSPAGDSPTGSDSNHNGRPDELVGHGTMLAGLANHIAPGSQILPVRVLDSDGVGSSFSVAAGIYYAIDHGANIVNLSLSSPYDSLTVREAVDAARVANVAIVAAVANSGTSAPVYPAANRGVIAVGATDLADRHLRTSNYGAYLRFSAPGLNVISTYPGDQYASATGTSMSAALVSGAIARMNSRIPTATTWQAAQMVYNSSVRIDALNRPFMGLLGRRLQVDGKFIRPGDTTTTVEQP